jgi:hypothetical protein
MKPVDRLALLRVVSPCSVPWSSMPGDDAVRFCFQCRQNVYNFAGLSPAEALALVDRAEGRVCVRLTRRADGTLVTGDCWALLRRARKRGLLALAVAAPAILAAQLWSQAFGLRALYALVHRPPAPVITAGAPMLPAPPVARPGLPEVMGTMPFENLGHVKQGKLVAHPHKPRR